MCTFEHLHLANYGFSALIPKKLITLKQTTKRRENLFWTDSSTLNFSYHEGANSLYSPNKSNKLKSNVIVSSFYRIEYAAIWVVNTNKFDFFFPLFKSLEAYYHAESEWYLKGKNTRVRK